MRHKKYECLIVLWMYNEASPEENRKLENHLSFCPKCREFREDLSKLLSPRNVPERFSLDETLLEARKSFRGAVQEENVSSLPGGRIRWSRPEAPRMFAPVPAYAMAIVAVLMLVIGAAASYLFVNRGGTPVRSNTSFLSELSLQNPDNTAIDDVRFLSVDPKTGEIQFSFNFSKRYEMKGTVDDRNVQKVLAYALVNSDNVGTRLRTIGMLDSSSTARPDVEIRAALLKAVKSDDNAGVRREALLSVEKLPFDNDVKDAVLAVLQNDKNPGMRVAAINLLSEKELTTGATSQTAKRVDPKILNVLKESSASDQNKYVRLKAADMLKEFREL